MQVTVAGICPAFLLERKPWKSRYFRKSSWRKKTDTDEVSIQKVKQYRYSPIVQVLTLKITTEVCIFIMVHFNCETECVKITQKIKL